MRRALAVILLLAAGAAVVLIVQGVTRPAKPDPRGLAVICDRTESRCWQRGERVEPPRYSATCLERPGVQQVWSSHGAGSYVDAGIVYTCEPIGGD